MSPIVSYLCPAILLLLIACSVEPRDVETVQIGGSLNEDACGAEGVVVALDEAAAIRSGPGDIYDKIDALAQDTPVWLCEERAGWIGIVYSKKRQDCEITTPLSTWQGYEGPCSSGWVSSDLIEITAG